MYKPRITFTYEEGLQPGWILAATQDVVLVRPIDGRFWHWAEISMKKGDHFMVLENPFFNRKNLAFIIHLPSQQSFLEGLLGTDHFQQFHLNDKYHLDVYASEYYELILK